MQSRNVASSSTHIPATSATSTSKLKTKRPAAATLEVIDVDEVFALKYEVVPEDSIVPIGVNQFRQEYRHKKKAAQEANAGVISGASGTRATSTSNAHSHSGRGADIISSIGPAIQDMRSKRTMAVTQQVNGQTTLVAPPPAKRRKVDIQINSPTRPQVVAGPSRLPLPHSTASSSATKMKPSVVDGGNSDEVMFVQNDLAPRTTRTTMARNRVTPVTPRSEAQTHSKRPLSKYRNVIELSDSDEDKEIAQLLGPPKKKARVEPPKAPPPNTNDVIEISSSGSEEDIVMQDVFSPPPIPKPRSLSPDEDDDWDPQGWDVNDEDRWTTMPVNENKLPAIDDELVKDLEHLDIVSLPRPPWPRYIQPDTTKFEPRTIQRDAGPPQFIWDMLRLTENVRFRPRPCPTFAQLPSRSIVRPWRMDFDLYNLQRTDSFKKSPGAINRVQQKGEWTVITSGCTGGLPDVNEESPVHFNQEGSLITYNKVVDIPEGHVGTYTTRDVPVLTWTKHYAVHDIQFDPLRESFASSGADRKVRIWSIRPESGSEEEDSDTQRGEPGPIQPTWKNWDLKTYNIAPHDLSFKPKAAGDTKSFLAIAERRVQIFSFTEDKAPYYVGKFSLFSDSRHGHIIGTMAWGIHSTANCLFASSEPHNPDPANAPSFDGFHKAIDIERRSILYQFDAKEAGDTICVDETGKSLALATRAADRNILRLYDISNKQRAAKAKIDLEAFPVRYADFEGEVTSASFSPDSILLALGRSDNTTHVYDVRYLEKGPICQYGHMGYCKAAFNNYLYGIAKVQWLQSSHSRRLALVTAGEDGCVRVWDPSRSPSDNNGEVVAEVNSDIGYFSLGDPYSKEHQLIVGDCAGEVSIFNTIVI